MFNETGELHIKGINIDWDNIDRRSYLRGIHLSSESTRSVKKMQISAKIS